MADPTATILLAFDLSLHLAEGAVEEMQRHPDTNVNWNLVAVHLRQLRQMLRQAERIGPFTCVDGVYEHMGDEYMGRDAQYLYRFQPAITGIACEGSLLPPSEGGQR